MWRHVWPGFTTDEVPITSITNGVHTYSWIAPELGELYETYLGPRFKEQPEDPTCWDNINRIPDGELWRSHQQNKEQLVFMTRDRLRHQLIAKGKSGSELKHTEEILDPYALTIGFARRFAAYKRGYLLFSDLERLKKLLSDESRPVQLVLAGKAHPKDNAGKEIIKSIMHIAQREEFRNRIVFLENYDLDLAYRLVAGVDVWLNTPRRPLEASGTSGMKAGLNGAINLSILDGWWAEGYTPETGWTIGIPTEYSSTEEQDFIESQALYDVLERDVIPMFYHREKKNYSQDWVRMMKNSIIMSGRDFSSHRMLKEYCERFYIPAIQSYDNLVTNEYAMTRDITTWSKRINQDWGKVSISSVEMPNMNGSTKVGQTMLVKIKVYLGELSPEDIKVEVIRGNLNAQDQIVNSETFTATLDDSMQDGHHEYHVDMVCTRSGRMGVTARIVPNNEKHVIKHHPRLIAWHGD
jgi:starch phosphorylase